MDEERRRIDSRFMDEGLPSPRLRRGRTYWEFSRSRSPLVYDPERMTRQYRFASAKRALPSRLQEGWTPVPPSDLNYLVDYEVQVSSTGALLYRSTYSLGSDLYGGWFSDAFDSVKNTITNFTSGTIDFVKSLSTFPKEVLEVLLAIAPNLLSDPAGIPHIITLFKQLLSDDKLRDRFISMDLNALRSITGIH